VAHGKHPLDVFRSNAAGFDRASRSRRTVSGKVISSSARKSAGRETEEPPAPKVPRAKAAAKAGTKTGTRAGTRTRVSARPTSARARAAAEEQEGAPRRGLRPPLRPKGINVKGLRDSLFSVALLTLAVAAVWIVVKLDWGDSGPVPLKTANADDVLQAGPGAVDHPDDTWYTVRVATYTVNEIGTQRAWETRDLLEARGFAVFDPVGVEQVGEDGVARLALCQLLVGHSTERSDLELLKANLRDVNDWPHGDPRPFVDAEIVLLPQIVEN
jgi:hypothetical protein